MGVSVCKHPLPSIFSSAADIPLKYIFKSNYIVSRPTQSIYWSLLHIILIVLIGTCFDYLAASPCVCALLENAYWLPEDYYLLMLSTKLYLFPNMRLETKNYETVVEKQEGQFTHQWQSLPAEPQITHLTFQKSASTKP